MTVRLRPHHLLCMLTYVGKGYSPDFVANFDRIAVRLGAGEDIAVHDGPDDVCQPLLGTEAPHCLGDSARQRDARALHDLGELLGRSLLPGQRLRLDAAMLERLRAGFASGATRAACAGCEWSGLCSKVAGDGFASTLLSCPPPDRSSAVHPVSPR